MSAKDYDDVIVKDDRTPKEKAVYNHLVIAVDTFMSGWGMAKDGKSIAAWACTKDMVDTVQEWVESRSDMVNVIIQTEPLTAAAMCRNMNSVKHISIYKVTEGHRYARPKNDQ